MGDGIIKVLFLIPTLGHGGAERVLVNLVNHMDKEKYKVTVQTMFDVGVYRERLTENIKYIPGLKWYFRGNTKIFKLFSSKQLFQWYIHEQYDVIVSYLEGPSSRVVCGCTDKKTKLVNWVHIEINTQEYASSVFRSMREAENCYKRFDQTICVSDTVKQAFVKMFDVENPVDVLYNTVETDVIRDRAKEQIDDINYCIKQYNIISVAKLMKTKGYERLVNVLKRLINDGIDAHVYIIGIGEEKGLLEKLIAANNLDKYWTFVGYRDNPYKYVANADLYVCSSYIEGFSTAVTEALIVGTPVVSTNCSGAYELLGYDNEYGIVTENNEDSLYEGVKRMLTEEGLLEHYKQKAIERGNFFSTEKTVRAVEKMLEEVVER